MTCVVGVVFGSAAATFAPAALFKIVFAAVSAAIGVRLLLGKQESHIAKDLPAPLPMRIIGFAIGVLSALMGISGGMLTNMAMLMFGRSIHQAVATSAGLGVFISIPGAIGYALAGWPHAAPGWLAPKSSSVESAQVKSPWKTALARWPAAKLFAAATF